MGKQVVSTVTVVQNNFLKKKKKMTVNVTRNTESWTFLKVSMEVYPLTFNSGAEQNHDKQPQKHGSVLWCDFWWTDEYEAQAPAGVSVNPIMLLGLQSQVEVFILAANASNGSKTFGSSSLWQGALSYINPALGEIQWSTQGAAQQEQS